ncbi:unnamed protein product [Triticum turgidum subsp. durum]|uniref:Uncharacterized protein n=1 Tax=Triticum turgidum subsp. durum TaxID=4567 RepID=A0A9R0SED2_TRITD|nr:unnamed protein product [Triticum turgidum subsp. durum]
MKLPAIFIIRGKNNANHALWRVETLTIDRRKFSGDNYPSYELYDNNDSQVQQELVQKIWKVFKTILEEAMELLWLVHMWLSKQDKFLRRTLIAMDHKISYVAPYCVLLLTLDLLSSKRDIGIIVHLEKSVLYLRQNIGMLMIGGDVFLFHT